jgi:hypothetical protein
VRSQIISIQLLYTGQLLFLNPCNFVPDNGPSEGPKHVAFLVQTVKGFCIRWQFNTKSISHLLDITMTSKAYDQRLCVVSFNDHSFMCV